MLDKIHFKPRGRKNVSNTEIINEHFQMYSLETVYFPW